MRLNRWSVIIGSTSAVLGSVIMSFQSHGATPLPDDLQFVPTNSLPEQATWYSTQMWDNYPPSPFNWLAGRDDVLYYQSPSFGTNKIIIDDSQVDYTAMQTSADGPPFPGDGNDGGTNYGGGGFISPKWGSNDLYLTINVDTNQPGYVDLILHGATNAYWQLLSKTNVAEVKPWTFGEILYDDGTTNELFYTPVPFDVPPFNFFEQSAETTKSQSRSLVTITSRSNQMAKATGDRMPNSQ